jgi:diadenosine tetraphosphate (Ap4A) HIT family hydrolase
MRRPAAINIGINDGRAAGLTVLHAQMHLIPRYEGDHPDPCGGVRWVLPQSAIYWSKL